MGAEAPLPCGRQPGRRQRLTPVRVGSTLPVTANASPPADPSSLRSPTRIRPADEPMTINHADFEKVEMRVGRVQRVEEFPNAREPAYKLWIDFGELGVKQTSAQITALYDPGELAGRLVVAVTNFPPKQIANFMSEVLLLGAPDENGDVVLLMPDADVPVGARVY